MGPVRVCLFVLSFTCRCLCMCLYTAVCSVLNCLLLQHVFYITPYSTPLVCAAILYLTDNILRLLLSTCLSLRLSLSRCSGGRTTRHLFILLKLQRPAADGPAHTMETTAASTVTHLHAMLQIHTRELAVCQVKQICCRFVISSIHLHFSTTTGVSDCTRTHTRTHIGRLLLNNCSRSMCVCICVWMCVGQEMVHDGYKDSSLGSSALSTNHGQ